MNSYSLNSVINNPYQHQLGMPNTSYNAVDTSNPLISKPLTEEEAEALKQKKDNMLKYSLILPVYYVLKKGTDAFDNACKGLYEESLSYKMSKLGDKISNSKFANSGFMQKLSEKASSFREKARNFIDTHSVTKTIKETPANAESKLVTDFLKTQEEELASGFSSEASAFIKGTSKLKNLRINSEEAEFLRGRYGVTNVGSLNKNIRAIQDVEFLRFGKDTLTNIDKIEGRINTIRPNLQNKMNELITQLNGATSEAEILRLNSKIQKLSEVIEGTFIANMRSDKLTQLKKAALSTDRVAADVILAHPEEHIKEIIEVCKNNGSKAFGKKSTLDIFGNKLRSMTEPASKLGKLIPKAAYTGMRGLVFTGGTIAILAFVAPGIAQTIVDTKNAEKGKKTATFADGLMEAISWVVSIPIAVKTMFGIGGLKYLGMDKTQVQNYRNELKLFNQKATTGLFANKAEYDAALKSLNDLKKTGDLSLGQKIIKKAANVMMVGHETPKPYMEAGKAANNLTRKIPYLLKEGAAYPVRFGLYMFAFAPVVDGILSGACHLLFGKPAEKPEDKKQNSEPVIENRYPVNPNNDYSQLSDNNLIKQALNTYMERC
ncbi:hypothetical protein IJI31_06390 [bacterium]|nr:hypothetical protein [bacterium]